MLPARVGAGGWARAARIEKFKREFCQLWAMWEKVGDTDHAGSNRIWGPSLWGGVKGQWGHIATKENYMEDLGRGAAPHSHRGPRE